MISPKDEFRSLKNVNNIADLSYFTLFEKYIKLNLKGGNKLIEIDSTDQESILSSKNGGYPIPGIIYTFLYKGPSVIITSEKDVKDYIDLVPIVLCINNDRTNFSGINMNVLPPDARLDFLESFWQTFSDFLEKKVDLLAENGKESLNKRFIDFAKSGGGQTMIKLFNRKTSQDFNFAYRKYSFNKISNFRMIEYSEWKYIPHYKPKDAFRKINFSQLHKIYDSHKYINET